MGVCLYFRTRGPINPTAEQAIRADVSHVGPGQSWILCEPPHFYPPEGDGILLGGTKLNLHPWPDEYREAMADPPERNDLDVLLAALTDWSARFELTWDLDIDGTPLGSIDEGDCPPGLADALQAVADVADELEQFDPMTGEFAGDEPDEGPPSDDEPPDGPPTGPRLYRG
jgi:hypothetical protein